MRILYSSDPHLHIGNFDTAKKFLEGFGQLVGEVKPDLVVLAGDLFHTHSILRVEIVDLWVRYFEVTAVPHIALVGNHDQQSAGSRVHALAPFRKLVKVVDAPYILKNMLFLPYVHTYEEFRDMLTQRGNTTLLFCHQSFDGAQFENGFFDPSGYPIESVADFRWVISGHIHKQQKFANIFFPGTPFAHSFNDAGERKEIFLIDTETMSVQGTFDLGLPKYHVNTVDANQALALLATLGVEDHHKLIIKGSKAEITAVQDSMEFKELRKNLKLTVCPEYVDVVVQADRISDSITPEQMVEVYIRDIMKTELDRDKLIDMSTRLMAGRDV